jgi:hypothetical protein
LQRRTVIAVTLAPFAAAIGCGLVSGLDTLKVGDAAVADAAEGGLQCGSACGFTLPSSFSLVTFASISSTTCPDTTTSFDVVTDPTVATDACKCQCAITTKGACSALSVELLIGDAGLSSCTTMGATLSATPGCHATSLVLAPNTRVDNNSAGSVVDSGACGNSVLMDAASLAATPGRVCVPSSCDASASLCTPPAGQRLCAAAEGDVACPDPFSEKHLIGDSASVVCSPCGTSCAFGNQDCNGHLTLYEDNVCSTGSQSASSCSSVGFTGKTVKSYDYTMTVSGGCTTTETSTPSTPLASPKTVCCRPGM